MQDLNVKLKYNGNTIEEDQSINGNGIVIPS
jgi:hypothetical protein